MARATTGDVVLVCTLGLSILSATRDLAVALVDVTQHVARLTEAIATLLLPHELRDHPEAEPLVKAGAAIVFNKVSFRYPGGLQVLDKFSLRLNAGQRVGLVGQSGGGKSTLFVLLQRFYDVESGPHLHRWPEHLPGDPGEPSQGDFGGAAGHLAVPSIDHGKYPVRTANCD